MSEPIIRPPVKWPPTSLRDIYIRIIGRSGYPRGARAFSVPVLSIQGSVTVAISPRGTAIETAVFKFPDLVTNTLTGPSGESVIDIGFK